MAVIWGIHRQRNGDFYSKIAQSPLCWTYVTEAHEVDQSTRFSLDLVESLITLVEVFFVEGPFCLVNRPLSRPAAVRTQFLADDECWWCVVTSGIGHTDGCLPVVLPVPASNLSPPQPLVEPAVGPQPTGNADESRSRTAVTMVTSSSSTLWFSAADTSV